MILFFLLLNFPLQFVCLFFLSIKIQLPEIILCKKMWGLRRSQRPDFAGQIRQISVFPSFFSQILRLNFSHPLVRTQKPSQPSLFGQRGPLMYHFCGRQNSMIVPRQLKSRVSIWNQSRPKFRPKNRAATRNC